MKLTMKKIAEGEEEVLIRYREMSEQIEAIAAIVQGTEEKITAFLDGETLFLRPESIYYLESVDGITYAYLKEKVVRVAGSLRTLEMCYGGRGFFRCSKSMILNLYKLSYLKSETGGRIRATIENGEQVMISRKYARELRRILKGGEEHEE